MVIRLVSWCVLIGMLMSGNFVSAEEMPPRITRGEKAVLISELIYPLDDKPTPECHASTIIETPQGLVAAWFAGTEEGDQDVGIRVSHRTKAGWTRAEEVVNGKQADGSRHPCWNPVLFQPSQGPLMLFYKVGPSPSTWWGMLATSEDGGQTWSKPWKLGTDARLGEKNPNLLGPVKNKPIQLADGAILCPSSSEHQGWRVHLELTRDLGKTWEVIGPIEEAVGFDAIQPSLLLHPEGRLQILCRSRQGVIAESWSDDQGKTWSPLASSGLKNPNSGTDAVTLADGRQLLVYNPLLRTPKQSGREMLNVAVSEDGKAWQDVLTLEREVPRAEFSYPAVIQTADGHIHITYTFQRQSVKYVVLDPEKF